ncbi:hypothetical protein VN97_g5750 [Penicillium thymicola]|uniref:3-deoxy-7-phosphoheptulonate synthase n=1 Tax=Penicillium thymicola TaxID=293382 RepID=A0AAI9X8D4_PENTH|nr:hypothetical protein VN97_g5750 [Penicillium thymicola]
MPSISASPFLDTSNIELLRQRLAEDSRIEKYTPSPLRSCRIDARQIIRRESDRLFVLVGPCSIHDPESALEYAARLRELADELRGDLRIVMRAYLEKPPTTVGWKDLINDPDVDDSYNTNKGVNVACEMLDTISPYCTANWPLVCRSRSASRTPRMPPWPQVNSLKSMHERHNFMTVTKQGIIATTTEGNEDGYVILRGGSQGANFDAASV